MIREFFNFMTNFYIQLLILAFPQTYYKLAWNPNEAGEWYEEDLLTFRYTYTH